MAKNKDNTIEFRFVDEGKTIQSIMVVFIGNIINEIRDSVTSYIEGVRVWEPEELVSDVMRESGAIWSFTESKGKPTFRIEI